MIRKQFIKIILHLIYNTNLLESTRSAYSAFLIIQLNE